MIVFFFFFADNKKAFGYWSPGLTELRWISYDEVCIVPSAQTGSPVDCGRGTFWQAVLVELSCGERWMDRSTFDFPLRVRLRLAPSSPRNLNLNLLKGCHNYEEPWDWGDVGNSGNTGLLCLCCLLFYLSLGFLCNNVKFTPAHSHTCIFVYSRWPVSFLVARLETGGKLLRETC